MNEVTSLILRRMRMPLILIISVYSISILVLTLIPGVDDNGNVWHMSIFHAFYFVSYTATTIGFGEIPYPLTEAQRLWTVIIIYMTVITWFYALGTVIALMQDKTFIAVSKRSRFRRDVKNMHRPYYVVCGYGETGRAVVDALLEEHFGAVVIEILEDISDRGLNDTLEYVPNLTADASDPAMLEIAGVDQDKCRGVIAVTASDETNLKIAISSKLLHPDVTVVCRSEYKEHENNMLSFGTDHIINPFESFTSIFSMALHSPSMHLIYEWLTGAPDVSLSSPIDIKPGHWILSGYGRLGKQLHHELLKKNIRTVIIDPDEKTRETFIRSDHADDQFIIGTGTDAPTLLQAGIESAAGVIAGTDNDSNNLSIIMTARQLNDNVFVVGRQNLMSNELLYSKINEHYRKSRKNKNEDISALAHLVMQPSEVIARKIRAILIAPLLIDFIQYALNEKQEWANITISRLSAVVGDNPPNIWTVNIGKDKTPAIAQALGYGRRIELRHLIKDPVNHDKNLRCIALLLKRGDELILLPEDNLELKAFDQLLFCGLRKVKHTMSPTLRDLSILNYVMTSKNEPQAYIWKKLTRLLSTQDRRSSRR
ncbi:MAG TPA: potassium transporter TrkA [Gammaproteobacteria bacterium]|nr:potassium transporter TrkA [Gammaproteobacteria bacterium]